MKRALQLATAMAISILISHTSVHAQNHEMTTSLPGVLTIAIDSEQPLASDTFNFFEAFAYENGLVLNYVEVPFENSWTIPEQDLSVDVVATGISAREGRETPHTRWTHEYAQEKTSTGNHESLVFVVQSKHDTLLEELDHFIEHHGFSAHS